MDCSMEKKEADNKKNLKTVLEDRGKITATIEELDRYKRDALQNTWGKVSEYVQASSLYSQVLTHALGISELFSRSCYRGTSPS